MEQPPRRVAIITGSAQGIGLGIAQRLAKDGLNLVLFDLPQSESKLENAASGIRSEYGIRVVCVVGDVAEEADVQRLVDTTVNEFGGLDVMVANAGIQVTASLHESGFLSCKISVDQFDRVMAVNVRGVFLCYKHAAIRFIAQGRGGRIIGATSIGGKQGVLAQASYCASKFAVRGLTQCAALDYGKYNITVNAYSPGAIETPLFAQAREKYTERESGNAVETWDAMMGQFRGAVGRMGQSEDVAKVVSFLASDEAAFITGQSINVDGGTHFD